VYFMIVLTTVYCWRSWTCRIAAPYKFHVDWLIDWLIYTKSNLQQEINGARSKTNNIDITCLRQSSLDLVLHGHVEFWHNANEAVSRCKRLHDSCAGDAASYQIIDLALLLNVGGFYNVDNPRPVLFYNTHDRRCTYWKLRYNFSVMYSSQLLFSNAK